MSRGTVSFESRPSVLVTWTIPDSFKVYEESGDSVRSPDFTFAGDSYCLQIVTLCKSSGSMCIRLLYMSGRGPGRAVLYDVALKSKTEELEVHRDNFCQIRFLIRLNELERRRDLCAPGGTLTVLCSVRLAGYPTFGLLDIFPQYRITGTLSYESEALQYVKWSTPRFFQVARERTYTLQSPEFTYSGCRYSLRLVTSADDFNIVLVDSSDAVPGMYVSYEVGLTTTTEDDSPSAEIYMRRLGTSTTPEFNFPLYLVDFLSSEFFSGDQLTVFCSMRQRTPSIAGSPTSGGAETTGSQTPVPRADTLQRSVGVQTSDDEEDKEGLPGMSKLVSDFRRLLLKGVQTDACLVVGGKEFRAHQIILRGRSRVFDAMFGHETAERESGRVDIDDLDPDSFSHFLDYLYTGVVGAGLSDDNAFGLYKAADKYDVPTLKAECVAHMRRSLSVDSFCDVLAVSLRHREEELLSRAVTFYKDNMASIIVTTKWQQFVIDNPTSANELLIKAVVPPGH